MLVLQPRVPVHFAVVESEDGAMLAHLRLRKAGGDMASVGGARSCEAHLQASVAGDDFKARNAVLALDGSNLHVLQLS